MLILTRRDEQEIQIGPDIAIRILDTHKETERIGIEVPQGVTIMRGELLARRATLGPRPVAVVDVPEVKSGALEAERVAERLAKLRQEAEEREALEWQRWAESRMATA